MDSLNVMLYSIRTGGPMTFIRTQDVKGNEDGTMISVSASIFGSVYVQGPVRWSAWKVRIRGSASLSVTSPDPIHIP